MVAWSSFIPLSSILVIISSGAAEAAVVTMLLSSLGLAGYAAMLYNRYRVSASKVVEEAVTQE
ncbi:MAG: hypothetical protein SWK76_13745 [Actinomycetota bacterium]|nr:hypothetical protein [Actinomycetota bacterium]